ncbi:MAG: alkaline phosphatase D family protein [Thermomicrobiales bacterium]
MSRRTPPGESSGNRPRPGRLRVIAGRPSPLGIERISEPRVRQIRWAARAWSGLIVLTFWTLLFRLGAPFVEDVGSWQRQVQIGLLVTATIGAAIAWRIEIAGATVMILSGAGLGVLATFSYSPTVAFLPFAAFLVPSVLHWIAWQRTQPALAIAILALFVTGVAVAGAYAADNVYQTYFGPTHPASASLQPPANTVYWAWAGGTTSRSTVIKARLASSYEEVRLAVSDNDEMEDPVSIAPAALSPQNVATFEIDGLEPDRRYYYALEIDRTIDETRRGQVQTFPDGAASFSFAFGACARTGSNGAVFDTIRDADPLFYLSGGDLHYGDINENDPDLFRAAYQTVLTTPAQALLYRSTSTSYIWDDHDYGANDSDRTSPSRDAAFTAYDESVPHYELAANDAPAIYQAFTVGRVRFILTDLRSARDPASQPDTPEKSMMGEKQKAWFKQELLDADGNYPVIVWLSTVPWIAGEAVGADHWGGYSSERREIAEFIAENDIDGLLMLGGDAHMVAIDDGSNNDYAKGDAAHFPVFHAAALDRYGTTKGGPYSEGEYPGGGQFGIVSVEDDGGDEIAITLSGRNWRGDEIVSYRYTIPVVSDET